MKSRMKTWLGQEISINKLKKLKGMNTKLFKIVEESWIHLTLLSLIFDRKKHHQEEDSIYYLEENLKKRHETSKFPDWKII